jgi:hypothetical protein
MASVSLASTIKPASHLRGCHYKTEGCGWAAEYMFQMRTLGADKGVPLGSKWTVVKGKKSDGNETKQALTEVKMQLSVFLVGLLAK